MHSASITVQEAVKRSLQTEKNAMDFYAIAARKMTDDEARRVFELLAREERGHAGTFYAIYTGTDIPSLDAYLAQPPYHESDWLSSLDRIVSSGFNEQKALELAMTKEQQLEEVLRTFSARIHDPDVKAVFELNIKETHNHYVMIESEYARIMGMVHESDIDTYVRE